MAEAFDWARRNMRGKLSFLLSSVKVLELSHRPFFVGTLFQPERAALREQAPPLVKAFVAPPPIPSESCQKIFLFPEIRSKSRI